MDLPEHVRVQFEHYFGQSEQSKMANAAVMSRLTTFLDGLTLEDAATLSFLLGMCGKTPIRNYWIGRTDSRLHGAGVCPACGADHSNGEDFCMADLASEYHLLHGGRIYKYSDYVRERRGT